MKSLAPFSLAIVSVFADTWCGKPYTAGSPPILIPPASKFPVAPKSSSPLLNFQCNPAIKPYIFEEDTAAIFILDAQITHDVGEPFSGIAGRTLYTVSLTTGTTTLLERGKLVAGSKGIEVVIGLAPLSPRLEPYNVSCAATASDGTSYHRSTLLHYYPPSPYGSITKMDLRTGGLLVRGKGDIKYQSLIPFGFYTAASSYLAQNLSVIDEISANGFNIIHPVPPFDNDASANAVYDRMEKLGLWLMFDMRHDYQNLSAVQAQVHAIKGRSNLLLWYTADEPDGWEYPLNSTSISSRFIKKIDPYHPVSLVLNCFDYYFTEYTLDIDIIMQDTYPIGINSTHSTVWNTECTDTYGDCGCDDCRPGAGLRDIALRMDLFHERARLLGKERTMNIWGVPQAFGKEMYWPRYPTGREFVAEVIVTLLHGGRGIIPWVMPSTAEITTAGAAFANVLPELTPIILHPTSSFILTISDSDVIEAGIWIPSDGSRGLLLIVNIGGVNASLSLDLPCDTYNWKMIFESGAGGSLTVGRTGTHSTVVVDIYGAFAYTFDVKPYHPLKAHHFFRPVTLFGD